MEKKETEIKEPVKPTEPVEATAITKEDVGDIIDQKFKDIGLPVKLLEKMKYKMLERNVKQHTPVMILFLKSNRQAKFFVADIINNKIKIGNTTYYVTPDRIWLHRKGNFANARPLAIVKEWETLALCGKEKTAPELSKEVQSLVLQESKKATPKFGTKQIIILVVLGIIGLLVVSYLMKGGKIPFIS